jgi:hypothetical protein
MIFGLLSLIMTSINIIALVFCDPNGVLSQRLTDILAVCMAMAILELIVECGFELFSRQRNKAVNDA